MSALPVIRQMPPLRLRRLYRDFQSRFSLKRGARAGTNELSHAREPNVLNKRSIFFKEIVMDWAINEDVANIIGTVGGMAAIVLFLSPLCVRPVLATVFYLFLTP